MKYLYLAIALTLSNVAAFSPNSISLANKRSVRSNNAKTCLHVKAQKAIKAAVEASRKFGPQSKEARLAWETVEEINASDDSVAFQPLDDTLDIDLELLSRMKHRSRNSPVKVAPIQYARVLSLHGSHQIQDDPNLKRALSKAELLTEWWGVQSTQAKLAWEEVEDILSNEYSSIFEGSTNPIENECKIDFTEACVAMEELEKVLFHHHECYHEVQNGDLGRF